MLASSGGSDTSAWVALRKSSRLRKWSWSFCQRVVYFSALITLRVSVAITPGRPSPSSTEWKRSGRSVRLHEATLPSQSTSSKDTTLSAKSPCRCEAPLIPPDGGEPAHRDVVVVPDDR